MLVKATWR